MKAMREKALKPGHKAETHPTKMGKVMHEYKHKELHSGSKKGPFVKSRQQAIAIGYSEMRRQAAAKKK